MNMHLRPVASGGETDTFGAVTEREDLSGVDPSNGGPGETVNSNKDVTHSNDTLGWGSSNNPSQVLIAIDTINVMPVRGHDGTSREMKDAANDRTSHEKPAAAEAINEGEDTSGGDKENDILDNGGGESNISTLNL
jgi:hypothetical protein